jgi:coronin-1B/1C/6
MGDPDRVASTGFSKMSERQVSIRDTSSLKTVKTVGIDQSAGIIMLFYSDSNILFLGECSVRCVGVATNSFDAS